MKIFFTFLGLLVFSFNSFAAQIPANTLPTADQSWEQVAKDDGYLIHRKDIADSDVVAFRGETVIDAPLAKVANVLIDTPRKLEWVAKIVEAKNIRDLPTVTDGNGNVIYQRIEYNHTSSGFLVVKNRDFVFLGRLSVNKPKQQVVFSMKSVEDPLMPETDDQVRGSLNSGAYTLTSIEGGKRTHVVVEIQADPKGSIPKWLVNLFQKSWPRKTLEGIAKQCAKADVKEHAEIKAFLEAKAADRVASTN